MLKRLFNKNLKAIIRISCRIKGVSNPEGSMGLLYSNHRDLAGGMWEEIGKLQFDFMMQQGLKPHHVLLDIGCGPLRGGVYFIKYLDKGNYLGIDKNKSLVNGGIEKELGQQLLNKKCRDLLCQVNLNSKNL